jgi:hypothetical protein
MDGSPLEHLAGASGRDFPHLMSARRYTAERLQARRQTLSRLRADLDVSVVLMGSWAVQS